MYEKAKLAFENYIGDFDRKNKWIEIKYQHTYQVVELMAELAYRLNLDKEDIELAKVIGLLHDLGRFIQIQKYDSVSDQKSGMDHAEYGCQYLFLEHHIQDFGILENSPNAKIIECAIRNHNKFQIDDKLTERELLFSKMIRDMDKVDIYRVLSTQLEYQFSANDVSEEVLRQFKEQQTIDIHIKSKKSDTVLFYLAFIFDINFDESFDIMVSTDNFDLFLSTIEVEAGSEKLWKKIREVCFDKINRGVMIGE